MFFWYTFDTFPRSVHLVKIYTAPTREHYFWGFATSGKTWFLHKFHSLFRCVFALFLNEFRHRGYLHFGSLLASYLTIFHDRILCCIFEVILNGFGLKTGPQNIQFSNWKMTFAGMFRLVRRLWHSFAPWWTFSDECGDLLRPFCVFFWGELDAVGTLSCYPMMKFVSISVAFSKSVGTIWDPFLLYIAGGRLEVDYQRRPKDY